MLREGETDMERKCLIACVAPFLTVLTLCAADGDLMATDTSAGFDVYTTGDLLYSAKSAEEVAALPPVVYRAGETVSVCAPNGAQTVLVSDASEAGTIVLSSSVIDAGGVWTFVNSADAKASLGVSWTVGGGGTLSSDESAAFCVDSMQKGPNRRISLNASPAVAYSGMDWKPSLPRGGDLTIVSPSGVTHESTGEVSENFTFDKSGVWMVTLYPKQGSICEALISVIGGFHVVVR
jgi:hypothetical protein